MDIAHSHIILDACCIFNLCASGCFEDVLDIIPAKVFVAEVVRDQELLTLPLAGEEMDNDSKGFARVIDDGLLQVAIFESEAEEETFVNFAALLGDDGESATIAIAVHRGWAIATDDKKALSFVREQALGLQCLTTPDLIKYWAETVEITPDRLGSVLNRIETNGHYRPPRNHPLRDWWNSSVRT